MRRKHHDTEFLAHKNELESGSQPKALGYFAEIYFALFVDIDSNLSPRDRLRTVLNEPLVASVLKGFKGTLENDKMPSASDIGEQQSCGRHYSYGFAVLA